MRGTPMLAALLAGISLATASSAIAQTAGPNPARTTSGQIDEYVAPLIALDVFSGVVLLMRDSLVLHERAYGSASQELGLRMTVENAFRIASISKSFTRALVGRLADQGVLSLDAPVAAWLPRLPSADRITLRMLLDHRAGVASVNSLPHDEEAIAPNSLEALVDSIVRLPLEFPPGTRQRYSNGGYALVARIVEIAAGRPYGDVLRAELLEPLGLGRTAHEEDGMIVPLLATGYTPHPARPGRMRRAPFQEMSTKTGGGSLVSTARDVARWVTLIGRSDVLRRETWRSLFPAADSALIYTGRAPGFNAAVVHDRRSGITAVVLANNYAAGMTAEIAEAALHAARGEPLVPLPIVATAAVERATLEAAPGWYQPPAGWLGLPPGQQIEVRRSGDHLVVHIGETPMDVLIPQGGRRFLARALWSLVSFPTDSTPAGSMEVRALYRDSSVTLHRLDP